MYTEEYLQQHDDAYSEDNISISISDSNYDSEIFQEKLEIELNKREDKGYRKEKVRLRDGTTHKIESYATSYAINAPVRHAVSGKRTRCTVGTRDENLFFIVTDTTANEENPRRLFYNTPEEFERHYRTTLPVAVKERFLQKR
jgi:hypothetical protein